MTTTRTVVVRTVAVVASLALVAWVAADARGHGVGARLAALDPATLVGVALAFAASYAMRAARIHGEFRAELDAGGDGRGSYARIARLALVHNALVNVLPFRSGEAAFPVLLSRWFGIGTGRAVVSLLWLRAQDAVVVLTMAALVWPELPPWLRVVALVAIVAGAAAVPAWARRRVGRPGADDTRLGRLGALLERSTRRQGSGWLWTIANWVVKLVAETWLLAVVLGPGAVVGTAAAGALGAELAAILPVQGVAGFGTFEAGAAALMRIHGVALGTGLEAALALHAVVLGLSLVAGALAAALLPGPRPGPRPDPPSPDPATASATVNRAGRR